MSVTPEDCFHLTVDIVREIHAEALAKFGGSAGVREPALLESAVAAPQASFAGKSVYADMAEIAAAYLFYLCRNHPFIDGNKRTALGACIVFLRLNGHAESATVLATYGRDFYAGRPALTVNACGAGKAYYVASRN